MAIKLDAPLSPDINNSKDTKILENIIDLLIPYAEESDHQETVEECLSRLLEELNTLREIN